LLTLCRFYWASLVLDIVLNDCRTANEVKDAILKLPIDLENLYMSCLERERGTELLCNPVSIMVTCAAPRPMQVDALCQLLALDTETGAIVSGDIMSSEAVIQCGVGLITLDKTEQLILPAHDSVRTFIFSPVARAAVRRSSFSSLVPVRTKVEEYLGRACLPHIQHKTSRSLNAPSTSSLPLPVAPMLTVDMPSWIRKPMKVIWPNALDRKTVNVNMPSRAPQMPSQHDAFFEYARDNWLACNRHLTIESPTEQMQLFSSIAVDRNESWSLHPWPALTRSRAQHLVGMFAYSVAHGHLPLLKLALQHKGSLPRGIFTGLLPNHGHMPALHAACKLGHFNLLPDLLTACNPHVLCPASKTVLHYAAESGHVECLEHLSPHRKGPPGFVNYRDINQQTALHVALNHGHEEFATSLVANYEADASLKDCHHMSSIELALDQGCGHFINSTLDATQLGEWLQKDEDFHHPLVVAAGKGNTRRVRTLVWLIDIAQARPEPLQREEFPRLALKAAVKFGHVDTVEVLLEYDHPLWLITMVTCLPFGYAVSRYYQFHSISSQAAKDIVGLLTTFLISFRHTINAQQKLDMAESETFSEALQAAAEVGHVDAVRQLLLLQAHTTTPGHMTDLRNNIPSRLYYGDGCWNDFHETDRDLLRIPAVLAAVRQHEEVLTLLLPTHNALWINELMGRAQSIVLLYDELEIAPVIGSLADYGAGHVDISSMDLCPRDPCESRSSSLDVFVSGLIETV
jgi:hypothetical protein